MPDNTTYLDYPYPLSGDKIAQGAVNIQDLAEAVQDGMLIAGRNADQPYGDWPLGMSIMVANSAVTGWPYSSGQVTTFRHRNANFAWQFFAAQTSVSYRQQTLIRYGYNLSGGGTTWTDWVTVARIGNPTAEAWGLIYITPTAANERTTARVTFPAGRFATPPKVFTQASTSDPSGVMTSPSSTTATDTNINLVRSNTTQTGIYWQAVEGGE